MLPAGEIRAGACRVLLDFVRGYDVQDAGLPSGVPGRAAVLVVVVGVVHVVNVAGDCDPNAHLVRTDGDGGPALDVARSCREEVVI